MKFWGVFAAFLAMAMGGAAQAQPSINGTVLSDEDGTTYLSESGSEEGASVYEWHDDGTFAKLVAPFGPFTTRDPRGLGDPLTPRLIAGKVGVVADGTILYQRGADGQFATAPLFSDKGGPLPCSAAPGGGGCVYVSGVRDDHGRSYHLIYRVDDAQGYIAVEEGGKIVEPGPVDSQLTIDDLEDKSDGSTAFLRDPDTGNLLSAPPFSGMDVVYDAVTATGRKHYKLDLQDTFQFILKNSLLLRNGTVYSAVMTYSMPEGGNPVIKVHVGIVKDPYGEAPELVPLFSYQSNYFGALGFAADDRYGYGFKPDGTFLTFDLKDGTATENGNCGYFAGFADAGSPTGPVIALCGTKVLEVKGGEVTHRAELGEMVYSGNVLRGAKTITLMSGGAGVLRIEGDKVSKLRNTLQPNPPTLVQAWQEDGHFCGVVLDNANTSVQCREGMTWTPAPDHPVLSELMRYPSGLWGLHSEGRLHVVYHLEGTAWVEKARADLDLPQGDKSAKAHFLASEGFADVVAIDPPARDHVLRLVDGQLVPGNSASRDGDGNPQSTRPVLDAAGNLFTRCGAALCVVAADGTRTVRTETESGNFFPLKRGVLLWQGATASVFRGARRIALGELYGQLHSLPERPVSLSGVGLFGKGMLIQADVRTGAGQRLVGRHYYLFDGETLQEFSEREVTAAGLGGNDSGVITGTASSTPSQPGAVVDYYQQTNVHEDGRGQFLRGEGLGPFGTTALGAAFAGIAPAYNRVTGIARSGTGFVLATNGGIVACEETAGAPLSGPTTFAKATDCKLVRNEGPVSALARDGGEILLWEGTSVGRLGGETISTGRASALAGDGDGAAWIEDGARRAWRHGGTVERAALPAGATAVSAQYACGAHGLAWFAGGAAWTAVAGVTECLGLAARGGEALILTRHGTVAVSGGVAGAARALPVPAHDDAVVGVFGDALAVAVGAHIFTPDGADVTPQWGQTTAVRARVAVLGVDGVSTSGGGALAAQRLFRLD